MFKEMERPITPEIELPSRLDLVVVLGGNVRPTKNRGLVTTSYVEGPEKSIGGHARVIAARELYRRGITDRFIISTVDAGVYGDELARYGIPNTSEHILLEQRPTTTLEDAKLSAMHIRNMGFLTSIGILTSYWHLDRAMIMFGKQDLGRIRDLIGLSADHIVAGISPAHRKIVQCMMDAPTTAERIVHERQGIQDFLAGKYRQRPFKWNFRDSG